MVPVAIPECIKKPPRVKVAFPGAQGWISQGKDSQVVLSGIEAGGIVSPHSHCEQFGIVLEGEMALTTNGVTHVYKKDDLESCERLGISILNKSSFQDVVPDVGQRLGKAHCH